jgi:hypothetical protein
MRQVDLYLAEDFKIINTTDYQTNNNNFNHKQLFSGEQGIWGIFRNSDDQIVTVDVTMYLFAKCYNQSYWTNTDSTKWVIFPKKNHALIEWSQGSGIISQINWKNGLRKFTVKTNTPSTLNLRTFYYPGWKIYVDSKPISTNLCTSDGRIQINLPSSGKFDVLISYDGTKAEKLGNWMSFIMLVASTIYFIFFTEISKQYQTTK